MVGQCRAAECLEHRGWGAHISTASVGRRFVVSCLPCLLALSGCAKPDEGKARSIAVSTLAKMGQVSVRFVDSRYERMGSYWVMDFGAKKTIWRVHVDEQEVFYVSSSELQGAMARRGNRAESAKRQSSQLEAWSDAATKGLAGSTSFKKSRPEFTPQGTIRYAYQAQLNGYRVFGYGSTLEVDAATGNLLAYAGRWKLPPADPVPVKPVSAASAARELARAFGVPSIGPSTDQLLAYCDLGQNRLRLCWRIKAASLAGTIDATTGAVISKELYK